MNSFHFKNNTPVPINPASPNSVRSSISVTDITEEVTAIRLKLNVEHTYTSDLALKLFSPNGQAIKLVSNLGGSGDNFFETEFSDSATDSITQQSAPFTGIFKSEEPLAALITDDINGNWILEIQDQAFQDGGTLTEWELSVETAGTSQLPLVYNNMTPQQISDGAPNTITSDITIQDQASVKVNEAFVTIDITHSYTNDLSIKLRSPDGEEISLVSFQGGSGDNFEMTELSDSASTSIQNGNPPFTGSFIPQEPLSNLSGKDVNGTWTLIVSDTANLDGGQLNFWKLCIIGDSLSPLPLTPFNIDVRFIGGLSQSQQAIFIEAAQRWSEAIVGDVPSFSVDGEVIDDLLILAEGATIDGPGQILGQAGPTHVRPDSRIPLKGIMRFDAADLDQMEQSGELLDVIIHEMGHVLGIGTLWSEMSLIAGSGSDDPLFIGPSAMREYSRLLGTTDPIAIPVANTGGAGTREGHWREVTFDTELMTGFDDPGRNAMSRMTIASLQDLGYQVNIDAADVYSLPLRVLSIESVEAKRMHKCTIDFPDMIVVSKEDQVS